MRIDSLLSNRENNPEIIWDEIKTYSMDEQEHPENYTERVVKEYRAGRVLFVEKELVPKSQ